jgi:DNA-directed RNA polymerase subunit M/transcription elongation factor TFIIS
MAAHAPLPLSEQQLAFLRSVGVKEENVLPWTNAHLCPACGEHFRSATQLDQHEAAVHERFRFVCTVCGKTFKSRNSKQVHASTFHHGLGDIACAKCGRSYSCRKYFLDHACEHQRRALQRAARENSGRSVDEEQ